MNTNYKHYKTVTDGEICEVEGVNIWEFQWDSNYQQIKVVDPIYGQIKTFNLFWIELSNKKIEFVAGEFSNCVWGIYTKIK